MFELDRATALENSHITVRSKSDGIPKSDGGLNAQLIFECRQSHLARKWGFNCSAALGGIAVKFSWCSEKMVTVTRSGS